MHIRSARQAFIALLVVLTVSTIGTASAGADEPGEPIEVPGLQMTQVSTPDSRFGLGRTMFDMATYAQKGRATVEDGYYRWDTQGDREILSIEAVPPLSEWMGNRWFLILEPLQWQAGQSYDIAALDQRIGINEPDLFSDYSDLESLCPNFGGTLNVEHLNLAAEGGLESLAFSYEIECAPGDITWGSISLGTVLPELPREALDVAATDLAYPMPTGEFDSDDFLDARVNGDNVEVAWAQDGGGFLCASVAMDPRDGQILSYAGRDDTHTFHDVDTSRAYRLSIEFYGEDNYQNCANYPGGYDDEIELYPTTAHLTGDSRAPTRSEISVSGQVTRPALSGDETDEPVAATTVQIWKLQNEGPTLLAALQTDSQGGFETTLGLRQSVQLWAVVPSKRSISPWDTLSFASEPEALHITAQHVVTARPQDDRVEAGSTSTVIARVQPRHEAVSLTLERKNQDGRWIAVDATASTPSTLTELTLPRALHGWQVLRVVADGDEWHGRGVSERLHLRGV